MFYVNYMLLVEQRPPQLVISMLIERLEIERRDLQELRVIEKKKLEREAVKLERERAVQSFKDDRKEVDRRGEFELKKAARLDYESGWRQRMGTDNTVEKPMHEENV